MKDFKCFHHATVIVLCANSDAAKEWVERNLPEDRIRWGKDCSAMEPRCIDPILDAIAETDLTIDKTNVL